MNAWWLLKSLRDSFGFSGREHNLKCSFRIKWRSDMLIAVNSAPCMFFIDSLSDTLMRDEHFLPQFASSSSCAPKNRHLTVFLWQWPLYLRQLSWQLCTANICVEFLIHPHSASLQTVCVVHMAVAVEPALCITGIPEDCPDQRVLWPIVSHSWTESTFEMNSHSSRK
jgi:hypothetical protein